MISNREVASNPILNRNVIPTVVAQAERGICHRPLVHFTLIPSIVILSPIICTSHHALCTFMIVTSLIRNVPRLQLCNILGGIVAGWLICVTVPHGAIHRLMKYILPSVFRDVNIRILESAYTSHRAEVVIKRAVLLHENYNVLDVLQFIVDCGCGCHPKAQHHNRKKELSEANHKTYRKIPFLCLTLPCYVLLIMPMCF